MARIESPTSESYKRLYDLREYWCFIAKCFQAAGITRVDDPIGGMYSRFPDKKIAHTLIEYRLDSGFNPGLVRMSIEKIEEDEDLK